MIVDAKETYVHLDADGKAANVPGGDAFWSLPPSDMDKFGLGWMVSEFLCSSDWGNWEMHPNGDEYVYVLEGAAEFLLETKHGIESIAINAGKAIVVPRGIWHTANVSRPTRLLHITRGAGTEHRAR
ncbi:MAG: cupin domain-containing protein [Casimicrobium sp.]